MGTKLDLNEITKKLNIGGLAHNIRSMVNPAGMSEKVDPSDALGQKLSEINLLTKELMSSQEKQVQGLSRLTGLIEGVYSDLEAIRAAAPKVEAPTAAPEAVKAEVKSEPVAQEKVEAPKAESVKAAPQSDEEAKP